MGNSIQSPSSSEDSDYTLIRRSVSQSSYTIADNTYVVKLLLRDGNTITTPQSEAGVIDDTDDIYSLGNQPCTVNITPDLARGDENPDIGTLIEGTLEYLGIEKRQDHTPTSPSRREVLSTGNSRSKAKGSRVAADSQTRRHSKPSTTSSKLKRFKSRSKERDKSRTPPKETTGGAKPRKPTSPRQKIGGEFAAKDRPKKQATRTTSPKQGKEVKMFLYTQPRRYTKTTTSLFSDKQGESAGFARRKLAALTQLTTRSTVLTKSGTPVSKDKGLEGADYVRPNSQTEPSILSRKGKEFSDSTHSCRIPNNMGQRTKFDTENGLDIYYLNQKQNAKVEQRRKLEFGNPDDSKEEKIILLLGATGSGKTTLINGMVNYIYGVKWEDDFRYKLIEDEGAPASQAYSQTSMITSYTLHHQPRFKIPYTLTIIDTPGFGDTAGIEQDKKITEQISKFFTTGGDEGLDYISAIGFVAKASEARLTFTQKYIFDSILSLFGKDIQDNIIPLITFGDGRRPKVLKALKEANMPSKPYFKFNSSALYVQNKKEIGGGGGGGGAGGGGGSDDSEDDDEDDDADFDRMFWELGMQSYDKFFQAVKTKPDASLTLTRELLLERESLHIQLRGINQNIHSAVTKLNQLETELDLIHKKESEIKSNRHFEYTVIEEKVKKQEIAPGQSTTICTRCKWTCHESCPYEDDNDKKFCRAMSSDGNCTVCKGRCPWETHKNEPYIYVIENVKVKKTLDDLKTRYNVTEGKRVTKDILVHDLKSEVEKLHEEVIEKCHKAKDCIARIRDIACKPNQMSVADYLDMMIFEEENERKDRYRETIHQLKIVREKAENLDDCGDQYRYKRRLREQCKHLEEESAV